MLLLTLAACPIPPNVEDGDDDWFADHGGGGGGGDDSATDWEEDSGWHDDSGGCDVEVNQTVPNDGAVDAYYRADLEFHLDDPDPTAWIETDIPGRVEIVEDSVYWRLSEPLAPNTSYSATLHYCGGDSTIAFTTSSLGSTPVEDASVLVGRAFELDLASARVRSPEGIGSVLLSMIGTPLVGVSAVEEGTIDLLFATASYEGPEQDFCRPTTAVDGADFAEEPYFAMSPVDLDLSIAGYDLVLAAVELTGTFSPDWSYIAGGTFETVLDTRPLAPLLDESGDEGAICDIAVNFGETCEPCPDDGEPFCLALFVDQVVAVEVGGVELAEVAGTNCSSCGSWGLGSVPPVEDQVCE